jgi:hypothetical protein
VSAGSSSRRSCRTCHLYSCTHHGGLVLMVLSASGGTAWLHATQDGNCTLSTVLCIHTCTAVHTAPCGAARIFTPQQGPATMVACGRRLVTRGSPGSPWSPWHAPTPIYTCVGTRLGVVGEDREDTRPPLRNLSLANASCRSLPLHQSEGWGSGGAAVACLPCRQPAAAALSPSAVFCGCATCSCWMEQYTGPCLW